MGDPYYYRRTKTNVTVTEFENVPVTESIQSMQVNASQYYLLFAFDSLLAVRPAQAVSEVCEDDGFQNLNTRFYGVSGRRRRGKLGDTPTGKQSLNFDIEIGCVY